MLVRISDNGFNILDDKDLANKILSAIMQGKDKFNHGEPIIVKGEDLSIQMVTSIKDAEANDGSQESSK